jgi:hypothetical protein
MPRVRSCDACHKTFSCNRALKRHVKESCRGEEYKTKYQCNKCLCYYSSKNNLARHKSICKEEPIKKTPIKLKVKRIKINIDKKNKPKSYVSLVTTNIGDVVIDILKEKLGERCAINFLLDNFLAGYYIKIIDECYINGKNSDQFPVVCKGGTHFRYLDNENTLVDDPTGELVVKQIINNIQNAVLRASNTLIRRYINDDCQESLYDDYDVKKIQDCVCSIQNKTTQNKIRKYLSKRVINSSHSFFDKGNNIVNLGKYY